MLVDRGTEGKVFYGEPLKDLTTPTAGTRKSEIEIFQEEEVVRERETFEQVLFEDSSIQSIGAELSTEAGFMAYKANVAAQTELVDSFSTQFKSEDRERTTVRHRTGTKHRETVDIRGGPQRPLVVRTYRCHTYHLYLSCIDHLTVDVRRRLGRRAQISKSPPAPADSGHNRKWYDRRPNVIACNTPIAAVSYWELMADSFPIVDENYDFTVRRPAELIVREIPADEVKQHPLRPTGLSLYELSHRAFTKKKSVFAVLPKDEDK